ncbi:hypothetical protein [Olsenella urininfantis]|uniref:hypothetical protein n=1 Tax=Olsenella urininfantis TaxID=1871033 RepID=UPI000986116C|nr:hypothetical protein [Olsenella urininfantis]
MPRVSEYLNAKVFRLKPNKRDALHLSRLGKVHMAVFGPSGHKLVGFLVSRPDVVGMIKRPDVFVALDSLERVEGGYKVSSMETGTDAAARKRLGIDWDSCVMWTGMDARTVSGRQLGYVNDASFTAPQGDVESFYVGDGSVSQSLVGSLEIPARLLRGYEHGCMLVENEASAGSLSGGVAAKAGAGYAKAKIQGKEMARKADAAASDAVDKGSLALGKALGSAKRALAPQEKKPAKGKGSGNAQGAAKAVGKQARKASGMFGAFMDEYKKASK